MITKFRDVCIDWNEVSAIEIFRFEVRIFLKGNSQYLTVRFVKEDDAKSGFDFLTETWAKFRNKDLKGDHV